MFFVCLFVLKIFDTLIFGQFSVLKTLLILKKGKASNSTEQNPLESLLTQIFYFIILCQFTDVNQYGFFFIFIFDIKSQGAP